MRRAGRVVFVVFLAWLLAIVLAGLGLIPGSGIPLTHALRPSTAPPPLATPPRPRQPPVADLRPALTAAQADAILGPVVAPASAAPGKSGSAPGRAKTTPTTTGTTTPGRSGAAPGHTKTTPTTTGTTTAPGKSGSAPGRTRTKTTKTKTTPTPGKKK